MGVGRMPQARTEESFRRWWDEVNQHLIRVTMLGCEDLPDQPYRDRFEDGWSAKRMVRRILKDEGFPI